MDEFQPLFDELGVLAEAGAQSAMVLFDTPDTVGDYAISEAPTITYPTGALTLAEDDAITVDGTPYVVRQAAAIDDGALTIARLKTA